MPHDYFFLFVRNLPPSDPEDFQRRISLEGAAANQPGILENEPCVRYLGNKEKIIFFPPLNNWFLFISKSEKLEVATISGRKEYFREAEEPGIN